jgi:hypothetical protein
MNRNDYMSEDESIRQETHERFLETANAYSAYRELERPPLRSIEAHLRFAEAFYELHERNVLLSALETNKEDPEGNTSEAGVDMARAQCESAKVRFTDVTDELREGACQQESSTALWTCLELGKWLLGEVRRIAEAQNTEDALCIAEVLARGGFIKPIPEQYAFDGWHVEPTVKIWSREEPSPIPEGEYVLTERGFAVTALWYEVRKKQTRAEAA